MSARVHKDWRPLQRELKAHGFDIVPGGKHNHIRSMTGKLIYTISVSPSCKHAIKNTRRDLVRMGVLPKAA